MVMSWECSAQKGTQLHYTCALQISSISLFLCFFLYVTLRTVIKSFPEFVHWFDWVFEHGGRVEISSFNHLFRNLITQEHLAGVRSLGSLDTSTCGISTNSTDMVSKVNGHWVACWVLGMDGCGKTTYLVSGKNPDSPSPVIWWLRWDLGSGE